MHAPAYINVKDPHQFIPSLGVVIPPHRREQRGNVDIGTHDRVEHPFEAEIGDSFETIFERVDAGDADRIGGRKALAREKAKKGGFAGPVGLEGTFVRVRGVLGDANEGMGRDGMG